MVSTLKVKNWSTFQHYKDRKPPWIKLHRGLLDDPDFHRMSDLARATLPMLWLLASEEEGALPTPEHIGFRLRLAVDSAREVVDELAGVGFLVATQDANTAEQVATQTWPSRYIPEKVRAQVLERDGGKCRHCGTGENLEIDHVIPVSKGGESILSNLQTLCRSCNRRKRVTVLEQVATQDLKPAEPRDRDRDRDRDRVETEKSQSISAPVVAVPKPAPWSREACDDWQRRFEGTAPGGRIGKALKPLVEKHGWAEVRSAWRSYLEATEPEFASPSRFANTYGSWNGTSAPAVAPKDKARLDSMTAFIRGGMRDEKRELGTGNGAVDAGILPGRPSSGS